MSTIKRFEDLDIWKRARSFSQRIYAASLESSFAKDFSLKDQINRSSGSIMDNIAEGFERDGRKEFIIFLSYSKGSAGECLSQLYRAYDRRYITEETFNGLKQEAVELGKMIGGFMNYLKASDIRGQKFLEPEPPYGDN